MGCTAGALFSRLADDSSDNIAVSVPNSNPFSPCNPGPAALLNACSTGALQVNYSTVSSVGPRVNEGLSKLWEATGGIHIGLPRDWKLTLQSTFASHLQDTGTTIPTAPNPGTYNFFCDDTTYRCNPAGTLQQMPWVSGTSLNGPIQDRFRYYELNVDGAVLTLPGGAVRVAGGLEYDDLSSQKHTGTRFDVFRKTRSGYAEMFIPIVGAANAMTAVQELGIDFAGRIDGLQRYRYDEQPQDRHQLVAGCRAQAARQLWPLISSGADVGPCEPQSYLDVGACRRGRDLARVVFRVHEPRSLWPERQQ